MFGFFRGWRTIIVNTIAAIPVVFDHTLQIILSSEFEQLLPHEWMHEYLILVFVINLFLRRITRTPMCKKE